jgi:hypothetical protein
MYILIDTFSLMFVFVQGEHTGYRSRVFKAGFEEICRVVNLSAAVESSTDIHLKIANQLTITQPNLLKWALLEYSSESKLLFSSFESPLPAELLMNRGLDSVPQSAFPPIIPRSLEDSRKMANAVHHYAHALVANSSGNELLYKAAIMSRKRVYRLLRKNLVAWKLLKEFSRHFSDEKGAVVSALMLSLKLDFRFIRPDWPELLKVSAIAGQHILGVSAPALVSMSERRRVAGEILAMLEEMIVFSHNDQHDAILLMVADVHQQIAVLDLEEAEAFGWVDDDARYVDSLAIDTNEVVELVSEYKGSNSFYVTRKDRAKQFLLAALHHLHLSVQVTEKIAEKSGRHILVTPYTLTANVLSSLREFSQAHALYEDALTLTEKHLGPTHASIIPLLVNYGISIVEQGEINRCVKGLSVLTRALALLQETSVSAATLLYDRADQYYKLAYKNCEAQRSEND